MSHQDIQRLLQKGLALHKAGRFAVAETMYKQALRIAPGNFDAMHLCGVVVLQQNRHQEAITLLRNAQRANPRDASCAMRLGIALNATGRFSEAEQSLLTAIKFQPRLGEAWFHLAMVLRSLGRVAEALSAVEKSVQLKPDFAEARDLLGAITVMLKGYAAGEPHFRRAIQLAPKMALAWCNLGLTLNQLGRLGEAATALQNAIEIDPKMARAHAGLGVVWERQYRLRDAIVCYRKAIAADPTLPDSWSCLLLGLHYLPDISREELWKEHQAFGTAFALPGNDPAEGPPTSSEHLATSDSDHTNQPSRPLKVGILSPDLRAHSVAYFLEPLLANLDRSRFSIRVYYDYAVVDKMTEKLKSFVDSWESVAGMLSDTLASKIRNDHLDVIIELSGHTGYNRLPIFAKRLAPVQVTYLGYPDTTGLSTMDYRLTDAFADPEGDSDRYHSEKLIRFAPTAWCYSPPDQAPPVAPPPCIASGGAPTFGCFNNIAKITDEILVHWAGLIRRVSNARLLLKGHGLGDETLKRAFLARLENAGLDSARVTLLERTNSLTEHLALYGKIDVALDTFPYHGTTTTCEALWMGVPVVTLAGDRHASRVGISLLNATGHPDLVAQSWEQYEELATSLAKQPEQLALLRATLRDQMKASPLLDHKTQATRFGAAILQMWKDIPYRAEDINRRS